MARYANRRRRDHDIQVGCHAWLSTEHLTLGPGLSRKLASKFVGPFPVVEQIGEVAFRLELPDTWHIHSVFHVSQLKLAVGF